eukprot:6190586-Pleurochrysis_carterae.AAC.1
MHALGAEGATDGNWKRRPNASYVGSDSLGKLLYMKLAAADRVKRSSHILSASAKPCLLGVRFSERIGFIRSGVTFALSGAKLQCAISATSAGKLVDVGTCCPHSRPVPPSEATCRSNDGSIAQSF